MNSFQHAVESGFIDGDLTRKDVTLEFQIRAITEHAGVSPWSQIFMIDLKGPLMVCGYVWLSAAILFIVEFSFDKFNKRAFRIQPAKMTQRNTKPIQRIRKPAVKMKFSY